MEYIEIFYGPFKDPLVKNFSISKNLKNYVKNIYIYLFPLDLDFFSPNLVTLS